MGLSYLVNRVDRQSARDDPRDRFQIRVLALRDAPDVVRESHRPRILLQNVDFIQENHNAKLLYQYPHNAFQRFRGS
jgi:hypothetical protein